MIPYFPRHWVKRHSLWKSYQPSTAWIKRPATDTARRSSRSLDPALLLCETVLPRQPQKVYSGEGLPPTVSTPGSGGKCASGKVSPDGFGEDREEAPR